MTANPPIARPKLILASASPRRLALLQQAGLEADALLPADIDETPFRGESPRSYAIRIASEKASAAAKVRATHPELKDSFLIAADTVVSVGRRILPKAETAEEAEECLRLLSGRQHRVYSAVSLVTPRGAERKRLVEARLRFKRLSSTEIEAYLATGEWRGKAGGYAIQERAGAFLVKLVGSYSAVVGLPLYETVSMLAGEGYPVLAPWFAMA
ncbi:Maf-like protein [Methylocystis sp. 9N]|uniref:dTTP/UTP pyrophosphatase n=1 Tax=Methylocystis borbori TaxID=3118750 RepID=A0ABU7XF25_9HYPH